ncbi:hypothetical protein PspLS_11625 [Pyricularia sp. CBS 133598]|nr:hypothetical protein PspLS_11625 [Pyricularia sp. CBS 133598]
MPVYEGSQLFKLLSILALGITVSATPLKITPGQRPHGSHGCEMDNDDASSSGSNSVGGADSGSSGVSSVGSASTGSGAASSGAASRVSAGYDSDRSVTNDPRD